MPPLRRLLGTLPFSLHFSVALRGTIAVGTPLIALNALGHPTVSLLATIGALQSTMADVGGSYRGRVLTLLLACILVPTAATLGSLLMPWWWAVTLGMTLLSLAVGLARSLGQLGTSLGFATAVSYLIGTALGGSASSAVLEHAGALLLGSVWTLCVALALWSLRPYKRLEYEVADCFAKVAALVRTAANKDFTASEEQIAQRRHALRQSIERARQAIGQLSSGTDGRSLTLPRLLVLVRSAARIGANAVTLADIQRSEGRESESALAIYTRAVSALADANLVIAHHLSRGGGELDLQPLADGLTELREELERTRGREDIPDTLQLNLQHAIGVLDRTLLHLHNAAEVLTQLFGKEHGLGNRLLPRIYIGDLIRRGRLALRANLNTRSLIFRHALRMSLAMATATACYTLLHLPHGLWIPLSVMVVLQPDFGGTRQRSVQRTIGTIAGVAIAGVLITLMHERVLIELTLLPLIFLTLLFLRSRYTLGVTLLTPFVILLLDLLIPGDIAAIFERIADTVAGAVLALLAGYWLWPSWQRERLPLQLAQALEANRDYAQAILERLAGGSEFDQTTHGLRRLAELEAVNTDAAYQNLLAEPAHTRGDVASTFSLVSYNERMSRNLTALGEHLGTPLQAYPRDALERWADQFLLTLDAVAGTIAGRLEVRPELTAFEAADAALRETPSSDGSAHEQRLLIEPLLQKIATDVSALYAAALRLRPLPRRQLNAQNSAS
ncbi:MAG: FUSC family protein [Acidihalobacter sp.]